MNYCIKGHNLCMYIWQMTFEEESRPLLYTVVLPYTGISREITGYYIFVTVAH